VIQESFALFQIISRGTMNFEPLLYIIRASKGSLLLLIRGLLAVISVISAVLPISLVNSVDLPIILVS
jgi:hypothetical protein